MWLFYVDECGDDKLTLDPSARTPTLKAGVSEWFVLSAVGVPAHSRLTLVDQLHTTKDRAFPNWKNRPWKDTEIKGRHLKQGMERLAAGKRPMRPYGFRGLDRSRMTRLCDDLGWVFGKYKPIVYVVAIDKKRLLKQAKPYLPVAIAYTFLQQRLALLVEQILGPSEGAVILADEQTGHESHFRAGAFHTVRDALSKRVATRPRFDLLLDKPIWVNANLSEVDREILQLPDIVAYAASATCANDSVPTASCYLWEPIAACLAPNWRTHKVPGGGLTIYPRPSRYPSGL